MDYTRTIVPAIPGLNRLVCDLFWVFHRLAELTTKWRHVSKVFLETLIQRTRNTFLPEYENPDLGRFLVKLKIYLDQQSKILPRSYYEVGTCFKSTVCISGDTHSYNLDVLEVFLETPILRTRNTFLPKYENLNLGGFLVKIYNHGEMIFLILRMVHQLSSCFLRENLKIREKAVG